MSRNSILLKPEFYDIDCAFIDLKSLNIYVIKNDLLMPFYENNFYQNEVKKVSQFFKGFNSQCYAITSDMNSNSIHLFSVSLKKFRNS